MQRLSMDELKKQLREKYKDELDNLEKEIKEESE